MKIENLFIDDKQEIISELVSKYSKEDLGKINDRVAYDFVKLFIKNEKFNDNDFNNMILAIKIVALANGHKHVKQSDLFALTSLVKEPFNNFQEKFFKTLSDTMFKELNYYLSINGDFKDDLTKSFEQKKITIEQREHTQKLMDWSKKQVKFLTTSIDKVLNGDQLSNIVYKKEISDFYNQNVNKIVKILEWHILGFTIALN